jgi:hypothetical protein
MPIIVGVLLAGVSAYAHHSQAAQYDTSKTVKIEGTLVQFQFRNPHTFIQVEAPDETGEKVRWSIEWGGVGQLNGQGVTRTTLKYGDPVIITANPSRTPNDRKLHMLTLLRTSDGFGWGTRPGEVIPIEP